MEIHYCAECQKRVSSVDIEQGNGFAEGDKYFCNACVRKLDLQSSSDVQQAGKKRTSGVASVKPSSVRRTAAAETAPARRTGSNRLRSVASGSRSRAPAVQQEKNNAPIVIALVVIVLGLIGALVFLIADRSSSAKPVSEKTPTTEQQPDVKTYTHEEQQGLSIMRKDDAPSPGRPSDSASQPRSGSDQKTGDPIVQIDGLSLPVIDPGTWEEIVCDPVHDQGNWVHKGGGSYTKNGDRLRMQGSGIDLYYQLDQEEFILEGIADFEDSTSDRLALSISYHLPQIRWRGKNLPHQALFLHADTTFRVWYYDEQDKRQEQVKEMRLWKAGQPVHFRMHVRQGECTAYINGSPQVAQPVLFHGAGGLMFSVSCDKNSDDAVVGLTSLRLFVPRKPVSAGSRRERPSADENTVIIQHDRNGYHGCEDGYVHVKRADTVDDHHDRLVVEKARSGGLRAGTYIRFKDLPEFNRTIQQATLTLYCHRHNGGGPLEVYQLTGPLDIARLTYNYQKDISRKLVSLNTFPHDYSGPGDPRKLDPPVPFELDVTAAVAEWKQNPAANFGLFIIPQRSYDSSVDLRFYASDRVGQYVPKLTITFK